MLGAVAPSWATITVTWQHDEARARGFAGNGQGSDGFDFPMNVSVLDSNVQNSFSGSCAWQSNSAQAATQMHVRRRMFSDRGMRITGSITASCSTTGFESVFANGESKHQVGFHLDRPTPYSAVVTLNNNTNVSGVFNLVGFNGFALGTGAALGTYTFSGTLVPGDYYVDYYIAAFASPGQAAGAMDVLLEVGRIPNPLLPQ